MSSATWCTSRTSPASTIEADLRARPSARTRWWCTAEVSSSDGIGARSASESRSESTTKRSPSAIAGETSAQISSSRAASAAPPPSTPYRPETLADAKPGRSPSALMWRILASSSLSITGNGSTSWRQCAGLAVEQVALGADVARQRGDELLADRVERRVGHLREQLGEVVEQQPRPLDEHRDRACRCPSSRAARRRSCAIGARRRRSSSSV